MLLEQRKNTLALELSGLVLVKLFGADVSKFLNSQLSNDLTKLNNNRWQLNGYCTAKGRLAAVMRLYKDEDTYFMLVPGSIADSLIKRLQLYVFRASVKIEKVVDAIIYGITGSIADKIAGEFVSSPISEQSVTKTHTGGYLLNLSDDSKRYILISNSVENFAAVRLVCDKKADLLWRLSEIEAGIAVVYAETWEKFIPQHVNLDLLGGISFTKGCFPGQEVVARLHYLGKSKQTMQQVSLSSIKNIIPGDTLSHPDSGKQMVVVDAVKTKGNHYSCLLAGQFD